MLKEAYTVGALMYSPAVNDKIAEMIVKGKIKGRYSLALCLEDSISDDVVDDAEKQIVETFKKLQEYIDRNLMPEIYPKIFIRVRRPEQILSIYKKIKNYNSLFTGFIFPKYSMDCAEEYNSYIREINKNSEKKVYMMPILESSDIIELNTRAEYLYKLKNKIDEIKDYVLNVRVGGNDFCKEFKVRRNYHQSIYDITPVKNILSDILTVFSREYVVSGPVWEYFAGEDDQWKKGLAKEVQLDKLNGFIGKTIIHPNQIEVVNENFKVDKKDYNDAVEITQWKNSVLAVGKSMAGERMNEVKVHLKWAEKILILAETYGVR